MGTRHTKYPHYRFMFWKRLKEKMINHFFIPFLILPCFHFDSASTYFQGPNKWTFKPDFCKYFKKPPSYCFPWDPTKPTVSIKTTTTTTPKPTTDIPKDFEKVSSFIFTVDGEEHAQEGFYDKETKEAIITSPAHSGYSATTSVITTKTKTQPAKMLTCHDEHCYYDNVFDELFLQPENILEHSTRNTRKVQANENTITYYVMRSGHREITPKDYEYKKLSENMKSVGKGKKIFVSNSKITKEAPSSDFSFSSDQNSKRYKRQSQGCHIRHGCVKNSVGCRWSFSPKSLPNGQTISVHGIDVDETCALCCNNDNVNPWWQMYVKCSDIINVGPQAYNTALAVTGYDNGEFNNYECHSTAFSQNLGAPYSTYDPNCHTFGIYFGTCVTNDGYCP